MKNTEIAIGKNRYPVIKVEASGRQDWSGGARTLCFVYSRDHGNFILEGYRSEVQEYLENNYSHYFCYISMWYNGQSRGIWEFWKNSVGIFEPSKTRKRWKYEIRPYTGGRNNITKEMADAKTIQFKRLPKHWIPEFDKF